MNTKVPVTTDVEPEDLGPKKEQDRSPAAMTAVAVSRINSALAAVPIDIALGALAICVAHAHYGLQKDPAKRWSNMENFQAATRKAINMVITEESLQARQLEAARKSDPIRSLNDDKTH